MTDLCPNKDYEAIEHERIGRGLELNDVAVFLEGYAEKGPPGWKQAAACFAHHIRQGAHRRAADRPTPEGAAHIPTVDEIVLADDGSGVPAQDHLHLWLAAQQEPLGAEFTKVLRETPYTESPPTQMVAAPGPTAGDVERAEAVSRRWAEANYGPNAGPLLRLTEMIAGALAAARAELLAQIMEPSELVDAIDAAAEYVSDLPARQRAWTSKEYRIAETAARNILKTVADKLTESK